MHKTVHKINLNELVRYLNSIACTQTGCGLTWGGMNAYNPHYL